MGAKLYSASRFTKIKEIIHKIRNNFHLVLCQNKGQVMNNKVGLCA